ncbi:PaaI family thioesterase [uncultured Albimonas sp.]|uniref:PaaI family thioesterase n=1 Tax=uncultured Albimonas sp. TaxID=1331701 RepID=UPI0030EB77C9
MTERPDVSGMSEAQKLELGRHFMAQVRWNAELGITLEHIEPARAQLRLPYDSRWVGDPSTGVLHGGVLTALLDACGGAAVMSHPTGAIATATISLRIDYMRGAEPGRDVIATAECHRATRHVAFVRVEAHDGARPEPVATATGSFTIERPRPKDQPKKEGA